MLYLGTENRIKIVEGLRGVLPKLLIRNFYVKTDRVATKSFRIQAKILNFPASRILWLNSYFPTDPVGANFDELLEEIETVMDKIDFDDILWNVDLN